MKLGTFQKQPGERESFTITYEDALLAGDNVATAVLKSISPVGTLIVDQVTVIDPRVRFWAEFGDTGVNYKITFTVTTEDGRRFEDEVTIKVKEL
jgi:hypothetical protein